MSVFLLFTLILVLLFLACMETGRRIRLRSKSEDPKAGLGTIEAATFGLLALLLGFTFSGVWLIRVNQYDTVLVNQRKSMN